VETRTAGSESGLGKRPDGNTGTAPQADSTRAEATPSRGSVSPGVGRPNKWVQVGQAGSRVYTAVYSIV
jgi:hypothetical protein